MALHIMYTGTQAHPFVNVFPGGTRLTVEGGVVYTSIGHIQGALILLFNILFTNCLAGRKERAMGHHSEALFMLAWKHLASGV